MVRRCALLIALAAAVLLLCSYAAAPAQAAVMGIDFGSEFIKVRMTMGGSVQQ